MATLEIVATAFFCLAVQTAVAQDKQSGSQAQPAAIWKSTGVTQAEKAATKTKLFGIVRSVDAVKRKRVVK